MFNIPGKERCDFTLRRGVADARQLLITLVSGLQKLGRGQSGATRMTSRGKSSWQSDLSSPSWLAYEKDRTEKPLNSLKKPSQHQILGDQESHSLMEREIMRSLGNA